MGLAILSSAAAGATAAASGGSAEALVAGYSVGFGVAAGLMTIVVVIALAVLRGRKERT
ncbi:hypothetical protein ITP53_25815 [Nonomuraea sp. K274]|uniref:Uncharacterized protein n=1 Tax=Nonomuraea cypriaca TaxID=1187855 RepID=A0A931AC09_9ACTN|nr:hypothetical protein [Nonomuraea cypriaca]MBF8189088.1 hypothetical protein [Nonomuraea cypriaca]